MKHSPYQSPLSESLDLKKRWKHSLAISKIAPLDAEVVFSELMRDYGSPKRYYHNSEHLQELFAWVDYFEEAWEDPISVEWAIWFHDVIYEMGKTDNEAQSANQAATQLRRWKFPEALVARIKRMIISTAKHELWDTHADSARFLDIDLAILGAPEARYTRYIEDIRKEYQIFPDMLYYPGRLQIVNTFLAKPQIYHGEKMKGLLEQQARVNLLREKTQLITQVKALNG